MLLQTTVFAESGKFFRHYEISPRSPFPVATGKGEINMQEILFQPITPIRNFAKDNSI